MRRLVDPGHFIPDELGPGNDNTTASSAAALFEARVDEWLEQAGAQAVKVYHKLSPGRKMPRRVFETPTDSMAPLDSVLV